MAILVLRATYTNLAPGNYVRGRGQVLHSALDVLI